MRFHPLAVTSRCCWEQLIITTECDPLLDEGELYAARLQAADVPVTLKRYDGMIHGFFTMSAVLDKSQQAIHETAQTLHQAFSGAQEH